MEFIVIVVIIIVLIIIISLRPDKDKDIKDDIEDIYINHRFSKNNKHEELNNKYDINYKSLNGKELFGIYGECYVEEMLLEIERKYGGHAINNFTFEDKEGYSTNIDHIFICKGGLFIIETKANKGTIYGDDEDEFWIAEKQDYQEDKTFKNPVKQNKGHINHLKKMMKNPPKMFSMIIFPVAESIENIDSKYVFDLNTAYDFILSRNNEDKYSEQYIKRIYEELLSIKEIYGITLDEHVKRINEMYH